MADGSCWVGSCELPQVLRATTNVTTLQCKHKLGCLWLCLLWNKCTGYIFISAPQKCFQVNHSILVPQGWSSSLNAPRLWERGWLWSSVGASSQWVDDVMSRVTTKLNPATSSSGSIQRNAAWRKTEQLSIPAFVWHELPVVLLSWRNSAVKIFCSLLHWALLLIAIFWPLHTFVERRHRQTIYHIWIQILGNN